MADQESQISIQQAVRDGRARLRRRRLMRAVGTPVLAASATLAIVVASALAATTGHSTRQQPAGYGKLVAGAFDPSHLVIGFGWLPKGSLVFSGYTSPGAEGLTVYGPHSTGWGLVVYAPKMCHVKKSRQVFICLPTQSNLSREAITGQGPAINGHPSLWLDGGDILAWQYATGAWAGVEHGDVPDTVRIARAVEIGQAAPDKYGQHVPIDFATRFTSLQRGWRIIGMLFQRQDGVFLAWDYTIARLHTISPATVAADDAPNIAAAPAFPAESCSGRRPGVTYRYVIIGGYRFTLSDLRIKDHGAVTSELGLCGRNPDGLAVGIGETAVGPHLGFTPAKVMRRLQLLGNKSVGWVTNPLP